MAQTKSRTGKSAKAKKTARPAAAKPAKKAPAKKAAAKAAPAKKSAAKGAKKSAAKPVKKPVKKPAKKSAAKSAKAAPPRKAAVKAAAAKPSAKPAVKAAAARPAAVKPVPVKIAVKLVAAKPVVAKPVAAKPVAVAPAPAAPKPLRPAPGKSKSANGPVAAIKPTTLSAVELEAVRRRLQAKKGEILAMYKNDLRSGQESNDSPTEDIVDRANNAYSRELFYSISDTERALMLQIDEALDRVAKRTYGRCAHCGEPIAAPRLEALPWARHCINCQELLEKGLLGEG